MKHPPVTLILITTLLLTSCFWDEPSSSTSNNSSIAQELDLTQKVKYKWSKYAHYQIINNEAIVTHKYYTCNTQGKAEQEIITGSFKLLSPNQLEINYSNEIFDTLTGGNSLENSQWQSKYDLSFHLLERGEYLMATQPFCYSEETKSASLSNFNNNLGGFFEPILESYELKDCSESHYKGVVGQDTFQVSEKHHLFLDEYGVEQVQKIDYTINGKKCILTINPQIKYFANTIQLDDEKCHFALVQYNSKYGSNPEQINPNWSDEFLYQKDTTFTRCINNLFNINKMN